MATSSYEKLEKEFYDLRKEYQSLKKCQIKFKKEQQQKFRRFVVFAVVLCLILSGLTGVASYSLAASDTSFTPHDITWNVENVEAALNNLNLRTNQLATIFSTEEQVVGRWVDGKKIYQKTFLNTSIGEVLVSGVDTVINYNIYREYASNQKNLRNISDGNNDYTAILLDYNNGNIRFGRVSSSYAGGSIIHATIQYTKISD